jgi:hypothetical protein
MAGKRANACLVGWQGWQFRGDTARQAHRGGKDKPAAEAASVPEGGRQLECHLDLSPLERRGMAHRPQFRHCSWVERAFLSESTGHGPSGRLQDYERFVAQHGEAITLGDIQERTEQGTYSSATEAANGTPNPGPMP